MVNHINGTMAAGDITFGSEYVFDSAITIHVTSWISALALDDAKFVVAYRDHDNSGDGTAVVGGGLLLQTSHR